METESGVDINFRYGLDDQSGMKTIAEKIDTLIDANAPEDETEQPDGEK